MFDVIAFCLTVARTVRQALAYRRGLFHLMLRDGMPCVQSVDEGDTDRLPKPRSNILWVCCLDPWIIRDSRRVIAPQNPGDPLFLQCHDLRGESSVDLLVEDVLTGEGSLAR